MMNNSEPFPPKLSLTVQYACSAQNLPTRAQLRRWVRIALQRDVKMTLRIVDENEGRELNHHYRGKDYATNVLTFAYDDVQISGATPGHSSGLSKNNHQVTGYPAPSHSTGSGQGLQGEEGLYGDVVICAQVVAREAAAQHKSLFAHYAHLAIHAALHLQGYEHENDADAAAMEALETLLMLKLRYPDPYQAIANG